MKNVYCSELLKSIYDGIINAYCVSVIVNKYKNVNI